MTLFMIIRIGISKGIRGEEIMRKDVDRRLVVVQLLHVEKLFFVFLLSSQCF